MKRLLGIVLVIALVFTLAACGGGGGEAAEENQPVTIVIAHASPAVHPYSQAIEKAIEWLAENTDGTITIDHQGNGALGGEVACIESAILGDIGGSCGADMSYATFAHALYALNFPGVFSSYEEAKENYWNGWGRELAKEELGAQGLTVVGVVNNYFRWWSNNDHPVTTWDGLKGLKIRCPESEYMISLYKELGCQPASVALGELATALQQGVVDAQELNPQSAYSRGYHIYQKYWTESNCGYSSGLICINSDLYNSLTKQQQDWINEAFKVGEEYADEYSYPYLEECVEKATADGCEFIRAGFEGNEELTEKLIEIGKKISESAPYDQYFSDELREKMYG